MDDAEEPVDPQSRAPLEHDAPGVSASILEGLDEILTVTRLGCQRLRRALMHQHRGECHEHRASRLPQREAMAIGLDGPPLDRGGYTGSRKGFKRLKAHSNFPVPLCKHIK